MPKPPVSTHPRACASICSFMFTDLGIVHGKEKEQKEAQRGPEAGIDVLISPPF